MRKTISSLVMFALANLLVSVAFAQNITIKGKVHNSVSMEAASAVDYDRILPSRWQAARSEDQVHQAHLGLQRKQLLSNNKPAHLANY